jgi:uncharacterized protein YcbX
MPHATIAGLTVYPVKSCRGIALERATLDSTGLLTDRRWMVISETGQYLTQRRVPRLAVIVPEVGEHELSLTAPGQPPLRVPTDEGGTERAVTVLGHQGTAIDAGEPVALWLTRFLGEPVRLVRFDPRSPRLSDPKLAGVAVPITFPDGFPLLLISEASLDDLNRRLESPVPMNRFRPNLVLEGVEAHEEDRILDLTDGPVRLKTVWRCPRCKITTTDQLTGTVPGTEPLTTLRSYRWDKDLPGVGFGQYAVIDAGVGAQLSVGQRLEIRWK